MSLRWMHVYRNDWYRRSRYGRFMVKTIVGPYVRRVYTDYQGKSVAVSYITR